MLRRHVRQPILWYRWLALVIGTAGYLIGDGQMTDLLWIALGAACLFALLQTALTLLQRSLPWFITVVVDLAIGSLLIVTTTGVESPFLLYYLIAVLDIAPSTSLPTAAGITVGLGVLYPVLCALNAGPQWTADLLTPRFLVNEGVIFLLALLVVLLIGPVLRWREEEGTLARYEQLFSLSETQRGGVIAAITEEVLRSLETDVALIFQRNPVTGRLEVQIPEPYRMTSLSRTTLRHMEWDQAFLQQAMTAGSPALLIDQSFDRFPVPHPMYDFFLHQPFLAAPIVRRGETIGLLLAGRCRERDCLGSQHLTKMAELAARAAQAISWVESLYLLRRGYSEMQAINQVLQEINSPHRLQEVLQRIVRSAREVLDADRASVMLLDPTGQWLRVRALDGIPFSEPISEGVPVGQGISGRVVASGEPLVITPDDIRRYRSEEEREVRQAICVPLRLEEQVIGVLNLSLLSSEERDLSREDVQLAQFLADAAAAAISKADLMEKVLSHSQELSRVNRQLGAEQHKLEQMIASIADGVLLLDANDQLSMLNDAAIELLELQGKDLTAFDIGAYLREQGLEELAHLLERLHHDPASLSSPLLYQGAVRSDGQRTFEIQANPIFSLEADEVHYEGAVAVLRDVTLKAEEEQVQASFMATLAEDIRSPLTSIKGYLDLLTGQDAGPLNEQQAQFAERATAKVEQAIGVLSDFLNLTRIQEEEQFAPYFEEVDLAQLVHEVAKWAQPRVASKQIRFRTTLAPEIGTIVASRSGLRQVLVSLLDNAIKNTSAQGQVLLRLEDEGSRVRFAVQDSGVGIAPDVRQRVFSRGAGLGMYIAKEIVEAHDGRIWLETEPGRGSVFLFHLPKDPTSSLQVEEGTTDGSTL